MGGQKPSKIKREKKPAIDRVLLAFLAHNKHFKT